MINFSNIPSPIIFKGDSMHAYRDPAAYYYNGIFYLFFTYVDNCSEGPFLYTAMSKSHDLINWDEPILLTPRDKALNFSSPGNIFIHECKFYMCLQTYPRENGEKYGNSASRIWLMSSRDLIHWSEPEIIKVKGSVPVEDMGRMIDPYIIRSKDDPEIYICFFKQNGVSFSHSRDLKNWEFDGHTDCGENVCVIIKDDRYIVFHSPENGIGVMQSKDLLSFESFSDNIYLGQHKWEWAKGRITAGFVLDLTDNKDFGLYLMFYHASGPESEITMFDFNASIGIAWSRDLKAWEYPDTIRK